ncbi:MAG TPA: trehalose-6-phosphate synthase [Candidatus Polarisedimenticolia bacterium]|nr:trehalose-6-phosphate synthase [Candidatus Polarisedimenticolia bacterium]
MMKRLIVVSNRLPHFAAAGDADARRMPVGGLATALRGALAGAQGSVWLGWSGEVVRSGEQAERLSATLGGTRILGLPLTRTESEDYYRGFCNEALWPLFHGFLGRVQLRRTQEACYRRVNERFARELRRLLRPGDVVWVHDYHFLCLGRELRRLGWSGPLGFFLHTPFPSYDLWQALPEPRDFIEALMEHDLIGFQTRTSLDSYVYTCSRETGARWDGRRLALGGRRQRAGAYPIGIEPEAFFPPPGFSRSTARGELSRVVRGRRLILGVDRLDYTKGIPERLLAFEALMTRHQEWRRRASFVQIASPSRSRVPGYVEQKQKVDLLVGRINGELSDHDWVPVRYLYRSYPTDVLAGFYREADIGLVTPLRDGMNLIAKEFVAAQDPAEPGVLVLSRLAGAAEELKEAVLVNPHLPSDTAEGILRALAMPPAERRGRHKALLRRVSTATAGVWSAGFLSDLQEEAAARLRDRAGSSRPAR